LISGRPRALAANARRFHFTQHSAGSAGTTRVDDAVSGRSMPRFSAPELVAEDAGYGYVMKAAIDPGTGRPVLAVFAGPPNAGRLFVIGRELLAP
jgi:hypothetical protein